MGGGGEVSRTLFALILGLLGLPLVLWIAFSRWSFWARLLLRRVALLADELEEIQSSSPWSPETSRQLEAYLEPVNRTAGDQCRSSGLVTLAEASALGSLLDVTRRLRKALRESSDPEAGVRVILESRRPTITKALDTLAGR
jgi:hypothetical protein